MHYSQSAPKPSYPRRSRAATETTKTVQQYLGDRIPSSPAEGEDHILGRQQAVEQSFAHAQGSKPKLRYIGDDHECFKLESVERFRKDYDIGLDDNRWDNFKRLLSGCQDLPFIILQNPTNAHIYEYEEMKKCPTIQWVSDLLTEIGLTLEDVVIVDICSLLSDHDLGQLNDEDPPRKFAAMERSYGMVEDILKLLEPKVLISCQCATAPWKRVDGRMVRTENTLATHLCSRESHAENGLTEKIRIGSSDSLLVYAVHPRRLCYKASMIPVLRGIFKDVYEPCMTWFNRDGGEREVKDVRKSEKPAESTSQPVVAVEEGNTGSRKSPKVVVTELDRDVTELGEKLSTVKLQEVN